METKSEKIWTSEEKVYKSTFWRRAKPAIAASDYLYFRMDDVVVVENLSDQGEPVKDILSDLKAEGVDLDAIKIVYRDIGGQWLMLAANGSTKGIE